MTTNKRPRMDAEVRYHIVARANATNWEPTKIWTELKTKFPRTPVIPSIRTVERIISAERLLVSEPRPSLKQKIAGLWSQLWRKSESNVRKVTLQRLSCNRCKHHWIPRSGYVRRCPSCRRKDWDTLV